MDKETRHRLEKAMKAEIAKLKHQIQKLQEKSDTVDLDQPIGRLSRMDSLTNQGIAMNSMNKARVRLAKLENALTRIHEEDFGLCLECGEPIKLARLLALPESCMCIDCAE